MTSSRKALGFVLSLVVIVGLILIRYTALPLAFSEVAITVLSLVLNLVLPGLVIDLLFTWLGNRIGEDIASKCGGLTYGGYLIGYVERGLIFLAVMIAHYEAELTFASVLSFLSVIVAGKAIFRYSNRETDDRACGDWYILGTLLSITMALGLSWIAFRFLFVG